MKEKLLEKIRALFRLADVARGASQAEAELAMEKAQMLMAKHGIEQIEVEEKGEQVREARKFNVHERRFKTGRQRHADDQFIGHILRECFNVRNIWSTYTEIVKGWTTDPWTKEKCATNRFKTRLTYILVGEPEDTEIAEMVVQELHTIMWNLYRAYLVDQGIAHNAILYNSYFKGVEDGFIAAAKRGQQQAFATSAKASVDQYALVLVGKSEAIQQFIRSNIPLKGFKGGATTGLDTHAHNAGYKAGGTIRVGQRKLS